MSQLKRTSITMLRVSVFRIYSSTSNLFVSVHFYSNEIFIIKCILFLNSSPLMQICGNNFKKWLSWLNLPFVWSLNQHLDLALKEPVHPSLLLFLEFSDYNRRALWSHRRIHKHLHTHTKKVKKTILDKQNWCLSRISNKGMTLCKAA